MEMDQTKPCWDASLLKPYILYKLSKTLVSRLTTIWLSDYYPSTIDQNMPFILLIESYNNMIIEANLKQNLIA